MVVTSGSDPHSVAKRFLSGCGCGVAAELESAGNARTALAKLAERDYDLLLMAPDVEDSEVDILVQELKKRGSSMPFVFIPEISNRNSSPDWISNDGRERSEQGTSGNCFGQALLSTQLFGAAEQSIGNAEDTLRTLFRAIEQAADLVVITDTCGVIEYVNPAFEKLTGYSRAEAIGQTPRILKPGEQSADLYRDLWCTIRRGETYRAVVVNRKKSGESYIVEKTITPVRNADGKVAHFISNDRDISERMRLEPALFQAQKMDAIGQLAGAWPTTSTIC